MKLQRLFAAKAICVGALFGAFSLSTSIAAPPLQSDLALWLETDAGVNDTAGAVTSWEDQTTNGNDLDIGGDPQIVASSTPTGEAAIVLDGDDNLVRFASAGGIAGLPAGNDDRSMFAVVRYNAAAAYAGVSYGKATTNQAFGMVVTGAGGKLALQGYGAGNDLETTTDAVGEGWLLQSAVLDTGVARIYKDGSELDSITKTYATDVNRIQIGREIGNAGYATMDVAAVLIYDRALSPAERSSVESYLTTKYINAAGNTPPIVTINTPANGTAFTQGDSVSFDADATDVEDDDTTLTAAISWDSNLDGSLNTGGSFSTTGLSVGVHTITASVTDSGSLSGSDSITVTVQSPGGGGTAPEPGTSTLVLELESTTGVSDSGGAVTGWTDQSGNGNDLVNGGDPMVVASSTPTGQPAIVLDGDDLMERVDSANTITGLPTGANERTVITVVKYDSAAAFAGVAYGSAAANSAFGTVVSGGGGKLALQGYVTDLVSTEQGSGEGWLIQAGTYDGTNWTLFRDNAQVATGAFGATTGSDRIVLGREIGNAGYATMEVAAVLIYDEALSTGELTTVYDYLNTKYIGAAGNAAPVVTINTPSNGTSVTQGDSVSFDATATDVEDDDTTLTAAIEWTSNIDPGILNTGGSFSTSSLSVGVHTITATVTDSGSLVGNDSITLTVQSPGGGGTAPEPGTSNLVLELESTTGVTDSGGTVTGWSDLSGNGNNLVNGGDPTIVAASTPTGAPSIALDGDDMLERLNSTDTITGLPTGAAERTVFSVVKYDAASAFAGVAYGSAAANSAFGTIVSGGTGNLALQGYVTDLVSATPGTGEGWLVQVGTYDGTDWTLFSDNAQQATGAFSATTGSDRIVIGREIGNAGYATMEVAAVLIYDQALSMSEMTTVYNYLNTKYIDASSGTPPTVTINLPADATTVLDGALVSFDADATDAEDDDTTLTAAIDWSSDIDGGLATGGSFSTDLLSPGVHTITAMVTDSGLLSDSDSITLTVDGPPVVAISAPTDGSTVASGDLITFTATATDIDGDLSAGLAWTSDLDGSIGSGATFDISTLSLGTHTITAEVTDSQLQTGSDTITLTVESSIELGLISKWELNETSGSDAPDSVGSNDGGLNAGPIWQPTSGRLAGALELANGDQVVNVPSIDIPGDEMAISVWVRPTSFAGLASEARFVSKAASTSEQDHYWMIGSFTDGTAVRFRLKTDVGATSTLITPTGKLTLNQWNHVVASYDGSTMKVYVNGAEEASMSKTGDITDANVPVGLGNQPTGSGNRGMFGLLDDVRLYGRSLTPTEITDLANPPNQPPTVVINSPSNGASANPGDSILFDGTAVDIEDGDVSASLDWTSNIDGPIGTGASFSLSNLSSGVHTITASAEDSGLLTGSANVTVVVTSGAPPPFAGDLVLRLESTDGLSDSGGTVTAWQDLSGEGNDLAPSGDPDVTTAMTPSGLPSIYLDGNDKLERLDSSDPINGLPNGNDDRSVFVVANYESTAAFAGFAYGTPLSDQAFGTIVTSPDGFLALQGFGSGNDLLTTEPGTGAGWLVQSAVHDTGTATLFKDGVQVGSPLVNAFNTTLSKIVIGEEIGNAGFATMNVAAVLVYDRALNASEQTQVQDFLFAKYFNLPPVVTISSPADSSTVNEGDLVTFTATATDSEDGSIEASLQWESDLDGSIGSGGTFDSSALSAGTHVITATATDSNGIEAEDTVTITVNEAPVVAITSPGDGTTVNAGSLVTFTGSALDAEDGDLAASLAWTSDLDGAIGSGETFDLASLSVGTHVITASVSDSNSLAGSADISLTINALPVVAVSSPVDSSTVNEGVSVTFTATATDFEDGSLAGSLAWTSSIDGGIGAGMTFDSSALSPGNHVITAAVTDSDGGPGSDAINLTVNAKPVVSITSPTDGSTSLLGTSVSFAATANDAEDGDVTASVSWASSLDGAIGSGASFSTTALTAGVHVLTATATDGAGLTGVASVTVTVTEPPVVTIISPADSSTSNEGDSVTFTATATDAEDGNVEASLSWSSDVDGVIGTGATFNYAALTPGPHVITATATDSGLATGSDSVSITVNAKPVVTITSPADSSTSNDGDSVTFTATATDAEDGNVAASLSWSSDVDGVIGTGATFNYAALTPGPHVITATATDSGSAEGSDSVSITVNADPVVTITSPADSSTSNEDDSVTFTATATDAEDGNVEASLSWSSDVDGVIGTGATFNYAALTPGPHVITATATDSGSAEGSDSVSITVNAKPVVAITSPADASTSNEGDSVTFTATATDTEDGNVEASLSWSSDVDGVIGTGATFNYAALTPGPHVITATATDSGSAEGSDSVSITVNADPVVAITSPADSSTSNEDDSVTFTATATDAEDGNVEASLSWSSDVDGVIGTGATFNYAALTPGPHVITATATDSGSAEGSDSVSITVNAKPVVAITSPADSSTSNEDDSVTFTATATDAEDGNVEASLSWSSDVDGVIGTGATFNYSALTPGPHVITATATDSGSAVGSDSVSITVNAKPVVAISSPADSSTSNEDDSVTFTATATDAEDGDIAASLTWSSDVDGPIGTGDTFNYALLTPGPHVITASVTDSGSATGSDSVSITVNAKPVVAISSPADSSTSNEDDSVTFTATASDDEDGDIAASLAWSSDVDGPIGTGDTFNYSL
ncbi:MAG: Ig-like domain-containing protein, partial [Verrucomicrobiota bacterium]